MRSCSVRAIDAAAGHFTLKAPDRIYIVSPRERWVRAQVAGEFTTPSLATEGFIHAATRTQVAGVLQRHFAGQSDLLLLEIDATALGDALRYEASPRSGELFVQFQHLLHQLHHPVVSGAIGFAIQRERRQRNLFNVLPV